MKKGFMPIMAQDSEGTWIEGPSTTGGFTGTNYVGDMKNHEGHIDIWVAEDNAYMCTEEPWNEVYPIVEETTSSGTDTEDAGE
ncbi:MAG: hypothetical protein KBT48_11820 [Firmicutes bacterium]|nr:hypothetical protein [Bacillota bacterium]